MLKSYNFWVRLVSVLVLLLRIVGAEFGFDIDPSFIIDIATVVASILVVLGVIQAPTTVTTDGKNSIGGNFMKTMEQVKADIILAKEKLIAQFGEESTTEIASILDNAVKDEETETAEALNPETETVEIEVGIDEVEQAQEVITEEMNPVDEPAEARVETECISNQESSTPIEAQCEVEGVSDDRIKEVLRARIMDTLTAQMDEIVAELTK